MNKPPNSHPTTHTELLEHYNNYSGRNVRLTKARIDALNKALDKYDIETIKRAIIGCLKYETNVNKKYKTLEYICRLSKLYNNVERFEKIYNDKSGEDKRSVGVSEGFTKEVSISSSKFVRVLGEPEPGYDPELILSFYEDWFDVEYPIDYHRKELLELISQRLKYWNSKAIYKVIQLSYYKTISEKYRDLSFILNEKYDNNGNILFSKIKDSVLFWVYKYSKTPEHVVNKKRYGTEINEDYIQSFRLFMKDRVKKI